MKLQELAHPAAVLPAELDGFRIELRPEQERADIVLDRPPFNVVSMLARDQLRIGRTRPTVHGVTDDGVPV